MARGVLTEVFSEEGFTEKDEHTWERYRTAFFVDKIVVVPVNRFLPDIYTANAFAGIYSAEVRRLLIQLDSGNHQFQNSVILGRLVEFFPRNKDTISRTFHLRYFPSVRELERDVRRTARATVDAACRFLDQFTSYEDILRVYEEKRYHFYPRVKPRLFDPWETLGILYCLTGQRERAIAHFRKILTNSGVALGLGEGECSKDRRHIDFANKAVEAIESGGLICEAAIGQGSEK